MSSEQHNAMIRRLFEELRQAGTHAATNPPAGSNGTVRADRSPGNQDARLARIAAHVAEEAAMLSQRS